MTNLLIQIDDEIREMNDQEFSEYKLDQQADEEKKAEALAKAEARKSALAKLAALGLTQEEIDSL
jgi:hypothetical protein